MNAKLLKQLLLALLVLCFHQTVVAQIHLSETAAKALIRKNGFKIGLSENDLSNSIVASNYLNEASGTRLVYLQQTQNGIPVYNQIMVLALKDELVVSQSGEHISKIAIKANEPNGNASLSPADAVRKAMIDRGFNYAGSILPISTSSDNRKLIFPDLGIARENIKVEMMYVPVDEQTVKLTWQVQLVPKANADHWLIRVDALDGSIVNKDNLTVYCDWQNPVHKHQTDCLQMEHYEANKVCFDSYKKQQLLPGNGNRLIGDATFRVIPYPAESPIHPGGGHQVVTNPWNLSPAGSNATTLKWNTDTTGDLSITTGNNVQVIEDVDGINTTIGNGAASTTALPDLTFNFIPNYTGTINTANSNNQKFMLTNLFYWNNLIHDMAYLYGFTEAAGNFQSRNLGRGGAANDPVIADGQDGGGTNNANMATPADGSRPRMQMFLWTYYSNERTLFVNTPGSLYGHKFGIASTFTSATNALSAATSKTADLVYYNDDAGGTAHTGCVVAANAAALNGKIALIQGNSSCTDSAKVRNAQNAGAIGVLVIGTSATPVAMTGSATGMNIPSAIMRQADGNALATALSGGTVNISMGRSQPDGDVDNGIIAHEYAHGISNRFTGGPATTSCLGNAEQMGEGWSDYYGLMMTHNWATAAPGDGFSKARGIGTYALGQATDGVGIRTYRYTTDMAVNPFTYGNVGVGGNGTAVHYIGSIWCTVLWDMTWALIQTDGINPNLFNATGTGGNVVSMRLVNEGMRLQQCNPGFVSGRNAILKADTLLYGGVHACTIWDAFARRGVGATASEGSTASATDQITSTVTKNIPNLNASTGVTDIPAGQNLSYGITLTGGCVAANNIKIVDTLPSNVTYVSGGTYNSTNRTVTINSINLAPGASSNFNITVNVNANAYFPSSTYFNENMPGPGIPANFTSTGATASPNTKWKFANNRSVSTPGALFAVDSAGSSTQTLTSSVLSIAANSTLSFWHYFSTENLYDGGIVEISMDGGTTWTDLKNNFTQNGYNTGMSASAGVGLQSKQAFSGSSGGAFINSKIDLSNFVGNNVRIRFYFASDVSVGGDGWYIDDVTIANVALVNNTIQVFNSTNVLQSAQKINTKIISGVLPLTWGNFTLTKLNSAVQLNWNTYSEQNVNGFVVQRSSDRQRFTDLGNVASKGNGNNNYQFTDAQALPGISYYRLKQVDNDGNYSYSKILSVRFDKPLEITMLPNPAKDYVEVRSSETVEQIQLLNALGQVLWQNRQQVNSSLIPLNHLSAGNYYIRVQTSRETKTMKLQKN
jgi:extracellular elastinolytic metalloproteinase